MERNQAGVINMKKLLILSLLILNYSSQAFDDLEDGYHERGFKQGMEAYQTGDYETALDVWTTLAEPGILDWHDADVESLYELGKMYLYGIGTEKDINKSFKLILKSAKQGNSNAQFLIGLIYNEGKLKPQDSEKALKWIKEAAEQGNDDAISWLAPKFDLKQDTIPNLNYGEYYALIIGNDNYQNQDLKSLKNAINDANAVAELLRSEYGFKVETLADASREETLKAISKIRKLASKKDNVLIYYAGHGWSNDDTDDGFWLPVDSSMDNEVNWIPNTDIIRSVRRMDAKHVIVVADSCFSGTLTRGVNIVKKESNFIEKIVNKKARTVLTSGGLEPVTDGGSLGHSIFASAFLSILSENQGVLDGSNLFNLLREKVVINSDQTPEYGNIRKTGHDGGDFLFVRQ